MNQFIEQIKPAESFSQREFLKEKYYSTLSFIDYWAKAYGELSLIKTCLIQCIFLSTGVTLFCFIPSAGILFLSSFAIITMFLANHFKIMENRFNKFTESLKDVDVIVDRMQKTMLEIVTQNDVLLKKKIQDEKELTNKVDAITQIKDKVSGLTDTFEQTLTDIDSIKQRLQTYETTQQLDEEKSLKLANSSQAVLKDCTDYLERTGLLSWKSLFKKPDLGQYNELLRRCELIASKI
jgi:hypothetical protein